MWSILAWIIVGGVAGWLANLVIQGSGMGLIMDIVVGVVGAIIGGALLTLLLPGSFSFTGFNFSSVVIAFIGSVVLLLVTRAVTGSRRGAI